MTFKVGDKVTAYGNTGVVTGIDTRLHYPVVARFTVGQQTYYDSFDLDGRAERWHKKPALNHVTEKLYIVLSQSLGVASVFNTKNEAVEYKDFLRSPSRIIAVRAK